MKDQLNIIEELSVISNCEEEPCIVIKVDSIDFGEHFFIKHILIKLLLSRDEKNYRDILKCFIKTWLIQYNVQISNEINTTEKKIEKCLSDEYLNELEYLRYIDREDREILNNLDEM